MLENKKSSQMNSKKLPSNEIELKIHFLDDSSHVFNVKKRCIGSELINQVFDYLTIAERDYFGIQIIHKANDEFINWIDPNKPLLKYVAKDDRQNCKLQFRVKFYVTDASQLIEDDTRHQFYLQIRHDIYNKQLECPLSTQSLLASYVVQAELGDHDPYEHEEDYLKSLKLLPDDGMSNEAEYRITEHHKLHRGLSTVEAKNAYLELAMKISLYGIYFFKSKDSTGKDILIGVTTLGVIVYQNDHVVNEFSWSKMMKISFKRRTFFMELKRELSENYDTILGFKMSSHKHAKAIWKTCVEYHSFFRLKRMTNSTSRHTNLNKHYFTNCIQPAIAQESDEKPIKTFSKTRSIVENRLNERVANSISNGNGNGSVSTNSNGNGNGKISILSIAKSYKTYDNKITSKQMESLPRKAWEQQNDESSENVQPLTHQLNDKNLITICMEADEQGRFGFNVRGGTDFNLPVLVSRIAPHSPADRAQPKIKEGDVVLLINGHDVSRMTHSQVVQLIKSTHEHNPHGQLVLTIRPCADETPIVVGDQEEPICQYVPDNFDHPKFDDAEFSQSLFLLRDGLASGALLEQFEQLYKKNPHLAITDARKPENLNKNRYRDILPYDCNRVVIANTPKDETDYINANYVNMTIPNDCVNRYIATQGPLQNTTIEFWRMVQQESSNFIVMLTTIMERGRIKCHQYWPQMNEEMQLTKTFSIKLLTEESDCTDSYILRKILLSDLATGEKRIVRQLQYLAWPDHGVPSDRTLFMNFVNKMREMRQENHDNIDQRFKDLQLRDADASDVSPEEPNKSIHSNSDEEQMIPTSVHQYISAANPPIIVHCSAGIGRTGMLVLMDTALSFMDVNEPIYPLDMVRNMRDQRACMVQNVFQYKFICECIFATYAEMNKINLSE